MAYGYVYLITNLINDRKYVGMRSSSTFDESYWGSGKLIRQAVETYGKENFKREILKWCDSPEELMTEEVNELISRNAKNSDEYYNLMDSKTPILIGEDNPFYGKKHSDESKKLISAANKGSKWTAERRERMERWQETEEAQALYKSYSERYTGQKISEEHRANIIASLTEERRQHIGNKTREFFASEKGAEQKLILAQAAYERFNGVPLSEEHKKNISAGLTGKPHPWQDSINKNPEKIRKTAEKHRGMKRSEESKYLMSIAKKGKASPNKGKKRFYNPDNIVEKILCFPDEAPEGWASGFPKKQ